jgi:2-oxoglutarate dehydrogenase E1 component
MWTDEFNKFTSNKFNTLKRFGVEGCDSMIPGLKTMIETLKDLGCEKVTIGMPHRGRLSLLANVMRKPFENIFAEFQGKIAKGQLDDDHHSGDVKYHLGTVHKRVYPDGKEFIMEILANPSHLECVNPVVMGRVRAENHVLNTKGEETERDKLVPILIHGDGSFAG